MREMIDSGVAWLGNIPKNWLVVYPKALFSLRKDRASEGERQLTASQQLGIVYQDEYMATTGQRVVVVEKDFSILKHVEAGDFVISMRSFQGGLEYSTVSGSISSAYVMLIPNVELVYSPFFKWLFKSVGYIKALQSTSDLIRDGQAMRYSNFVQVPLFIAPKDEQQRIADYLDDKCKKIDALIANQQAQIEKLKQYKQSLITEVVTKGLDPNAPIKDSGVEWIGHINTEFSLQKIKHFISDYKAGPFGSALITGNLLSEGSILVYTPEHIANQSTDNPKNLFLPETRRGEMEQFFVSEGNIIFPIVGSLGRAMYISADMPEGIINQRLAKFRIDESRVDKDYFLYLFAKSNFYKPFLDVNSRGAIIVNLTKEIVYNMPFIIPPLDEQKIIVKYLDEKCSYIDKLVSIKTQKAETLIQYKKSLIYEYVTGKKEVS